MTRRSPRLREPRSGDGRARRAAPCRDGPMAAPEPRPPRGPRVPRRSAGSSGVGRSVRHRARSASLVAPVASVIGLVLVAVDHVQPVLLQDPVRHRSRTPARAAASTAGRPVGRTVERRHRAAGGGVQARLHRLRQGGQHLGPERRRGAPDHLERRRFDAVVVARRRVRSTTSGREDAETNWRGEHYVLLVPDLMRVPADGSADPERLATGRFSTGNGTWAYWLRQPIAVTRRQDDRADHRRRRTPSRATSSCSSTTSRRRRSRPSASSETGVLGHQDPDGVPTATTCCTSRTGRSGSRGVADHRALRPGHQEDEGAHGAGVHAPSYSPGRSLHRGDADHRPRDGRRDPRREQRARDPARSPTTGVVQPVVVARRGRDRVPPPRRPDRGPPLAKLDFTDGVLARRGDHPADRGLRAGRRSRDPTGSSRPRPAPPPRPRRRPPAERLRRRAPARRGR